jgi:hypothetical protein
MEKWTVVVPVENLRTLLSVLSTEQVDKQLF